MKQSIARDDISKAFSDAGILRGANLLLHSSLSSIGEVRDGPNAVIDGILDVIGIEGTLMVPTFNYWIMPLFDPATTPGLTGVISEVLRKRRAAVRSLHPTHSFAALGPLGPRFVLAHEKVGAFQIDSPVDRLAKAGGFTVLLGVRHDSNSTVHVGEAYAKPWYLGLPFRPNDPTEAKIRDGNIERDVSIAGLQSGCSLAFNAVEMPLRRNNSILDFKLGNAICQIIPTQAIIDRTVELIRDREDILLCSWAGCFFCTNARSLRGI
ncbi:MAG TPA: AAC(3) family N-acetyltransferase [Edaphobacter sp.]|nr:AAC(3) family N-acetyltransferase [Edaphobacter sp.]